MPAAKPGPSESINSRTIPSESVCADLADELGGNPQTPESQSGIGNRPAERQCRRADLKQVPRQEGLFESAGRDCRHGRDDIQADVTGDDGI